MIDYILHLRDGLDLCGLDIEHKNVGTNNGFVYNGTDSISKIIFNEKILDSQDFTIYLNFTLNSAGVIFINDKFKLSSDGTSLVFNYDNKPVNLGSVDTNKHTFCAVRKDNIITCYLDGTSKGTITSSSNIDNNILIIGSDNNNKFTDCVINDFNILVNYAHDGTVPSGNFTLGKFCKSCQDYAKLTDEAKIAVFQSANGQTPTSDDILSMNTKVKILHYIQ